MKRFPLVLLTVALVPVACGQGMPSPYPVIDAEQLRTEAVRLAEAEAAGTEAGGRGEQLADAYLVSAFAAMGLRVQSQPALLTKVTPTGSSMTLSGAPGSGAGKAAAGRALQYGEDFVAWTHRHETVVSADADLVFVGYGISLPRQGWDDYKNAQVRGKLVVMLVGAPGTDERPLLGTVAETYYGRPKYKFEEAARRGAAGVLLIHTDDRAEDSWEVIRHSYADLLDVNSPAKASTYLPVEAWLNTAAARRLFTDAGLSLDTMMPLAEAANFVPVNLPLRAAIEVRSDLSTVTTNNIVAALDGAADATEHVIYSAQWNHLPAGDGSRDDLTDTDIGDQPPPGAAVLLEVARALTREPKLARSFVFLVVTAESEGLAGLDYYLANPVYPLKGTRAAIHIAGFSVQGNPSHISIIGTAFPALKDLVRQQAAEQLRVASPDADAERIHFYSPGEENYEERTIPNIFLVSQRPVATPATTPATTTAVTPVSTAAAQGLSDMSVAVLDAQLLFRIGRQVVTSGNWPDREATRALPGAYSTSNDGTQGQPKP